MTSYMCNPLIGHQYGLRQFLGALLLCFGLQLVHAETGPDYQFHLGQQYYNQGQYEKAIEAFLAAVQSAPTVSIYYHWLGKSYGRLAEESSLLKAYDLSGKTRTALEQAVALDNTNVDALMDLLKFYERAPAFLGGGQDKATRVRQRLQELGHFTDGV